MKKLFGKYTLKLKEDNFNFLQIFDEKDKLIKIIALPPVSFGIDIIRFETKIEVGYTHNFEGLVIITNPNFREFYHMGKLIYRKDRK